MQFWILVLIVIAIGIFLIALGAWFGYRYISEQDEIRPTVHGESDAVDDDIYYISDYTPSSVP